MSFDRGAMILAVTMALTSCKSGGKSDFPSDATALGTGTATLSWAAPTHNADGSRVGHIAGYYIYYGTSPTALTQAIQIRDPDLTSYVVKNLSPGTYYFSVATYTTSGIIGRRSEPVLKTIPK